MNLEAMNIILHICSQSAWNEAQIKGNYRAESLDTQGFIHCSTREQVVGTANLFFRGQQDLVLLVIDADRLTAPIKVEDADNGQFFPHVFGPLNLDAVVDVREFAPEADGTFGNLTWADGKGGE